MTSKKYGLGGANNGSLIYGSGGIRSGSSVYGYGGIDSGSRLGGVRLSSIPFKMAKSNLTNITGEVGTHARATGATVKDYEGVTREVLSGEIRFQGQRRVENLLDASEDFSDASWIKSGATVVGTNDIVFTANASDYIQQSVPYSGDEPDLILMISVTGAIGDTLRLRAIDVAAPFNGVIAEKTLTAETQIFSLPWQPDAGQTSVLFRIQNDSGATAKTITVNYAQLQNKTGASDPTIPDNYVNTDVLSAPYHGANVDGVKYFLTTNGNTVP